MVTDELYRPYRDEKYLAFSKALSPTDTLPRAGIRVPVLRTLAKTIQPQEVEEYHYHEDINLVGLAIGAQKWPLERKLQELDKLLPYLSSWDHTDLIQTAFKPKKKEEEEAYQYFTSLLKDERVYTKRLGIVWLMPNRKKYDRDTVLDLILSADDENEYYISMAVAWAVSFFFLDDPSVEPRLMELSPITRKRTLQKIRDSRRFRTKEDR
ncbi:MAG: DNA alkylation repair protein [Spirochaetales bacterium]|nr:DNA alkylation repair protein [Candidatus Physcosoma equi]